MGAQLAPTVPSDPAGLRYRDGAAWVAVQREGVGRVQLQTGRYTYHAGIGRAAILQPSAAVASDPARWSEPLGVRVVAELSRSAQLYLVESRIAAEDGIDLAVRLAEQPLVRSVVPDLILARRKYQTITEPPNDPRYAGQWYLKRVKMDAAWRLQSGEPDVIVVVIDDGCDMKHPDLAAALSGGGYDAVDDDDDPSFTPRVRGNAHGTQCAGLVGARANNGIGIAGVCPGCSMRCVRLLRADDGGVPLSADIRAFDYALDVGASVVSNSWGFADPMPVSAPLRNILTRLYQQGRGGRGTLAAFAAGNENRELGTDELTSVPGVVTIGATNNFDEAAPFGNFGPALAVSAPTGSLTTDITGADGDTAEDYTTLFGGTSSACPVAAGVLGLLFSAKKDLSAKDAADALVRTARKAPYATPDADGHDKMYGYGIIDPAAALRRVLGVSEDFDAGMTSPPDASMESDRPDASSGKPDASQEPATPTDASTPPRDAQTPDEQSPDARPERKNDDGGCAAVSGSRDGAPGLAWLALLGFVAFRASSRRKRASPCRSR